MKRIIPALCAAVALVGAAACSDTTPTASRAPLESQRPSAVRLDTLDGGIYRAQGDTLCWTRGPGLGGGGVILVPCP